MVKQTYKKLNDKQAKNYINQLHNYYGIKKEYFKDKALFQTPKNLFLTTKKATDIAMHDIHIQDIGILLARIKTKERLKLTTNAAQVLGDNITERIIQLTKEDALDYAKGYNLETDSELPNGYVTLKLDNNVLGVGLKTEGDIKNQVPKSRRLA